MIIRREQLPAPEVIETLDYDQILEEIVTELTGKSGFENWKYYLESDPIRKLLEVVAYREMLLRARINAAAKAVLVLFSQGGDLDQLAAFYGVTRLPAAAGNFTGRFQLTTTLTTDIPAGFQIRTLKGDIRAQLRATLHINDRDWGEGLFDLVEPIGAEPNGYLKADGWVAETALPYVQTVEQTTSITGGGNTESDEELRNRLLIALDRFSTAGPDGAYEYHARSVSEHVEDVSVHSPSPGMVYITIMSDIGDGTPDQALLDLVTTKLRDEKVRPLTDQVTVLPANVIPYTMTAAIYAYPWTNIEAMLALVNARVETEIQRLHHLGLDITRSALIGACMVDGVQNVILESPSTDIPIAYNQTGYCTGRTINFTGYAE